MHLTTSPGAKQDRADQRLDWADEQDAGASQHSDRMLGLPQSPGVPMKSKRGFTLIELMIVVLVIAVLAGLAMSSYNNQIRKSRRAEAKQVIADLALKEEKYRSNNATYGDIAQIGGAAAAKYYTVTLTAASNTATGYTFTAVPVGDQLKDTCGTLSWAYDAGVATKTPATCW